MKKAYVLLDLVALLTLTLSSCVPPAGWLHESRLRKFAKEDKMTEQMLEEFLAALKARDSAVIKSLFSKETVAEIGNLDQQAEDLCDFFEGEYLAYEDLTASGSATVSYGQERNDITLSCKIESSVHKYRLAMKMCIIDDFTPNNTGILSLYIINEDDIDTEEKHFTYWGGGEWAPGITVQ